MKFFNLHSDVVSNVNYKRSLCWYLASLLVLIFGKSGDSIVISLVQALTLMNKYTVPLSAFSIEYWNYIKSPDAFGPEQQIRISIAPIVPLPW